MATVQRKGTTAANVSFGTAVTLTNAVVQEYTSDYESQLNETPDSTGATVAAAFYDNKKQLAVGGLFNGAGAPTIKPGDAITINSEAGFVKTVNITQASTDWYKIRVNAVFYVDNTLS